MEEKEREVMKRLYEEYSQSLKVLFERIEKVHNLQKKYRSNTAEYKALYNRRRRLTKMYEDTYRWREMVGKYIDL